MSLIVKGLDLSLTSTGVAHISGNRFDAWTIQPGRRRGYERLDWLNREIKIAVSDADVIALEWLSFGSKGAAVLDLAGLWYIVALNLWQLGHIVVRIPPPVLKKYATGKGTASKDEVFAAAIRRFPGTFTSKDAADALWAAHAAADHYGLPVADMPKTQRDYLHSLRVKAPHVPVIEWPELDIIPERNAHAS